MADFFFFFNFKQFIHYLISSHCFCPLQIPVLLYHVAISLCITFFQNFPVSNREFGVWSFSFPLKAVGVSLCKHIIIKLVSIFICKHLTQMLVEKLGIAQ